MTPPELDGVTDKDRFELELEFVSALANPRYVHHLAKEGFLRDSRFVAFLRHLSYWERPEYAKFILYPHALRFRRELERGRGDDAIGRRMIARRFDRSIDRDRLER